MTIELADVIRPGAGRGLDFVLIAELRKRTGIIVPEIVKFAMSEMLCNSLDTDATEIRIAIKRVDEFDEVTVTDNGSKEITLEELEMILDFTRKASSKRGFLRVSRGYLGNALKCLFGYSYALSTVNGISPPIIVMNSHGTEYRIDLKPDRVKEAINSDIVTRKVDNIGNSFSIKFPRGVENREPLLNIIFATSMVNPTRKIYYNLWGTEGAVGLASEAVNPRKDTSIIWYEPVQFKSLFKDFVRATPDTHFKDLIALFRGFTGTEKTKKILAKLNSTNQHVETGFREFLSTTPIRHLSDTDLTRLYSQMHMMTKTIATRSVKKILGIVGKMRFFEVCEQMDWRRLRYSYVSSRNVKWTLPYPVSFPFIVEIALYDRKEDDGDGVRVYQCVNFMASMEDIFSKLYNIKSHMAKCGIREDMPVTVVAHLVCPVLKWLNYGKSGLGQSTSMSSYRIADALEKAMKKVLPIPRAPRVYSGPPPPKPHSWFPRGDKDNPKTREKLRHFAVSMKEMDSKRGKILDKVSARGWCYIFEGLNLITKGEFDAFEITINNCRKLGYLPIDFVALDQDVTRQFADLHVAMGAASPLQALKDATKSVIEDLPHLITNYWKGEKYYVMMCVEKIDLRNLFRPICRLFNIPIMNMGGWYTILPRYNIIQLCKEAEKKGLTPVTLLFYDHDIAGLKMSEIFKKGLDDLHGATQWDSSNLIIDRFGLNKEDIDKYNLMWINNLKSGSGRDPDYRRRDVQEYIRKFGERKCESNALLRNEETLRIGQNLCIKAIWKYYGEDVLDRFKAMKEQSKKQLKAVYDNPIWEKFEENIDDLIKTYTNPPEKVDEIDLEIEEEKVHEVEIDNRYYKHCPECYRQFDYDPSYIDRLVRCRNPDCRALMKLKKAANWKVIGK